MNQNCTLCGSDWIFVAPNGIHHLCEECFTKLSNEVIGYHIIQNDAHKNVIDGNVEHAIILLRLVQKKRNQISIYFYNNRINDSHYHFANDFIPALIENLSTLKNNPCDIWESAFASLTTKN